MTDAATVEIDWHAVQDRLKTDREVVPSARTYAALFTAMGCRDTGRARDLGIGGATYFTRYGITTPLRIAHFLGQTAHETMNYQFLRELWGPTPAQNGYEGRLDLGNNDVGDGRKYLGRGLIQITGKFNYAQASKRINVNLMADPTLAERPDIAVLTALDWWTVHGCSALADVDNAVGLSRLINRGSAAATRPANGEAERLALTDKAKALFA
jgi:putative chitinase